MPWCILTCCMSALSWVRIFNNGFLYYCSFCCNFSVLGSHPQEVHHCLREALTLNPSCPPILSSIGQPMYSREHGAAASERLQLGTPPPLLAARLVPPRNLMGSSIGYHTSVSSPTPLVPGKLCFRWPSSSSLIFYTLNWSTWQMTWHSKFL